MKSSKSKARTSKQPKIRKQNSVISKAALKLDSSNLILSVVCETDHYIIVDKPALLDCQNSKEGRTSVVDWLKNRYHFAGLVHRLDFGTSGLLVCAKNPEEANRLTKLLTSGKIKRHYTAIVLGKILPGELKKKFPENFLQIEENKYSLTHELEEKESKLFFRVIKSFINATLIEVELETGRKHQIRKQFSLIGHPLLGDHLYYAKGSQKLFNRPALHAHGIFIEEKKFQSALPSDLMQLLTKLK